MCQVSLIEVVVNSTAESPIGTLSLDIFNINPLFDELKEAWKKSEIPRIGRLFYSIHQTYVHLPKLYNLSLVPKLKFNLRATLLVTKPKVHSSYQTSNQKYFITRCLGGFSGYTDFFSQAKNMHTRSTGNTKLSLGVGECEW